MNKEQRLIEWVMGESYRRPRIEDAQCNLCGESSKCLVFKDYENYGDETICIECMKLAIELAGK